MKKIVVDTNIFLSALFSSKGASHKLVNFLIATFEGGKKINCVSTPSIMELEEVLLRDENMSKYPQFSSEDIKLFINDIVLLSHKTEINYLWRPFLRDSKDDKILETAFNGDAKYIITYNIADFKDVYEKFQIKPIKPLDYLKELS